MCEMVCRFWFVCHLSFAGLSHEVSTRWEKCPAVDKSGCEHSRLQEARFPNHCQCFDAKTVTATLVSTPTISEFPWILRGVDCRRQQSHVAVKTSFRVCWNFKDCFRTESRFRPGRVLWSCCHHQQLLRPLHKEAVQSSMTARRRQISSRACRSANCVSKAVIDYLVQQKVPEILVSEIA